MMTRIHANKLLMVLLAGVLMHSTEALACATCYGESDSPLAAGMTWGILTMIVVIYGVLLTIIGFFIFAARSAAARAALEGAESTSHVADELVEMSDSESYNDELCSKNC